MLQQGNALPGQQLFGPPQPGGSACGENNYIGVEDGCQLSFTY
jgi:hypothetical protein